MQPIPKALNVFTDGSSNGTAAVVTKKENMTYITAHKSAQLVELEAVVRALENFREQPMNIFSDSHYIVHAVPKLELAGPIAPHTPAFKLFYQIQKLLWARKEPLFVGHIRAHTNLPGPLHEGNQKADDLTQTIFILSALQQATLFHSQFHVNSTTLQRRFKITKEQARTIVKDCKSCMTHLPNPHYGVNPRGLMPNHLWQMDVTHEPSFGKLRFIHVTIDTCSGMIFASLHSGEKVKDVTSHCLQAFAALGIPKMLKTDNGPAYTSSSFKQFCAKFNISHKTGIPYNPQGQGIIERANRTLKVMLLKQKEGNWKNPRDRLAVALFTLNFLTLDSNGYSAGDRHWNPHQQHKPLVYWKDVLSGTWKGPDPVLIWGRGSVCVFPKNESSPIWIPSRLVKQVPNQKDQDENQEGQDEIVME